MVKIEPFGDRVVVEILIPEEIVGGLVVPTSKEKSNKGLIVAVGSGDDVKGLKEGEVVLFNVGSGINYTTETADYKILNVHDIVAKLKEE